MTFLHTRSKFWFVWFLASKLEAEKDVEEATDIKGPEEAEDFEENELEERDDEEQLEQAQETENRDKDALSEQDGK